MPWSSKNTPSCTLHVVHDPQSASASIRTSVPPTISARRDSGAGRAKVGFFFLTIAFGRARSRRSSSIRSRRWSPFAFEMSSRVTTWPSRLDGRRVVARRVWEFPEHVLGEPLAPVPAREQLADRALEPLPEPAANLGLRPARVTRDPHVFGREDEQRVPPVRHLVVGDDGQARR